MQSGEALPAQLFYLSGTFPGNVQDVPDLTKGDAGAASQSEAAGKNLALSGAQRENFLAVGGKTAVTLGIRSSDANMSLPTPLDRLPLEELVHPRQTHSDVNDRA